MNKKVFISMLTLTVVFLVGLYVAKIFFPQEFMMSIQNEQIIKIGMFIDNHTWLFYLCGGITAFVTYYLYCSACSGRLILNWYEILEIILVIIIVRIVSISDTTLSSAIQLSSFIFLPYLTKGNLRNSAITYTIHCISQGLSLSIRNLPIYMTSINFATKLVFGIESYLWLILLCIIFNYKKENKNEN